MTAHADQAAARITVPTPFRWLAAAALCAAALSTLARLRARMREPRLQPMSDEWLRSHAADRDYTDSL
jgi:hypothetical protein